MCFEHIQEQHATKDYNTNMAHMRFKRKTVHTETIIQCAKQFKLKQCCAIEMRVNVVFNLSYQQQYCNLMYYTVIILTLL